MKRKLLVFAVLALAACSRVAVEPFKAPLVSRNGNDDPQPLVASSDGVVVGGQRLRASAPGQVSFGVVPLCEAARMVLGDALSLPYTCSGGGALAFDFPEGSSARDVFEGFRAGVSRLGGSLVVKDGKVHVQGGEVREVSVAAGAMPENLPTGEASANGVEAFTYERLPDSFARRLRDQSFETSRSVVLSLPGVTDTSQARNLSKKLGLDVEIERVGQSVLAFGLRQDVIVLRQALAEGASVTVPVPVGRLAGSELDALGASWPDVQITYSVDRGVLWVRGSRPDVVRAVAGVRALVPAPSDYRVSGVFVAYDETDQRFVRTSLAARLGSVVSGVRTGVLADGEAFRLDLQNLVASGAAAVISKPSVVVNAGEDTTFLSGSSVPVVTSVDADGKQSVEYRDIGVVVRVAVFPTGSGKLRVRLHLELSELSGIGVSDSPAFRRRSVDTVVEVAPGDVVAVSGLEKQEKQKDKAFSLGFPSLGSASRKSSLAFFVTVVRDGG